MRGSSCTLETPYYNLYNDIHKLFIKFEVQVEPTLIAMVTLINILGLVN